MRITKSMKEYIEERLTEQRLKANKAARAAYEEKRLVCRGEIDKTIMKCNEEVIDILARHGMDTTSPYASFPHDMAVLFDIQFLRNGEKEKEYSEMEQKRYEVQKNAVKTIIFNAEAGGDRNELLAAIASVNFDI